MAWHGMIMIHRHPSPTARTYIQYYTTNRQPTVENIYVCKIFMYVEGEEDVEYGRVCIVQ